MKYTIEQKEEFVKLYNEIGFIIEKMIILKIKKLKRRIVRDIIIKTQKNV